MWSRQDSGFKKVVYLGQNLLSGKWSIASELKNQQCHVQVGCRWLLQQGFFHTGVFMPQACWPQSIPFTEAELNNNYRIAKRGREKGKKGERQRRCLRALLGPRKTLLQLSELVDAAENCTFFFYWILWFCLRKESKIERKNKVLLYKSAAAPCQIKGVTFLLLDSLSTSGAWQTANSWPAIQLKRIGDIFFSGGDKLIRETHPRTCKCSRITSNVSSKLLSFYICGKLLLSLVSTKTTSKFQTLQKAKWHYCCKECPFVIGHVKQLKI